jgi:hypothetical protein
MGAWALTGADVVVEGTVGWLEPEAAAGAAGSSVLAQQLPMAGASGRREFPGGRWGARRGEEGKAEREWREGNA